MNKKLIITTLTLILLFSGLQNASAYNLQEDIEYLSSISTPYASMYSDCIWHEDERTSCNYDGGKLQVVTTFYNNGEKIVNVVWKGKIVAVIDRGVFYKLSNGKGWQGYVHKVANEERHARFSAEYLELA